VVRVASVVKSSVVGQKLFYREREFPPRGELPVPFQILF
jgi:hypothetical protein